MVARNLAQEGDLISALLVHAVCVRRDTRSQESDPSSWTHTSPGLSSSCNHIPPLHPLAFGFLSTRREGQRITKGSLRTSRGRGSNQCLSTWKIPCFVLCLSLIFPRIILSQRTDILQLFKHVNTHTMRNLFSWCCSGRTMFSARGKGIYHMSSQNPF